MGEDTIALSVQWNTGALYTQEGQVIRAVVLRNGVILFHDFSRQIAGEIKSPINLRITDRTALKHYVNHAYIHNAYSYNGKAYALDRETETR